MWIDEGEDAFQTTSGRENGIHFPELTELEIQCLEIVVCAIFKYGSVLDLRLMNLAGLELHFSLEIYVLRDQSTNVDVFVHGPDGHIQFWVVCQNDVR